MSAICRCGHGEERHYKFLGTLPCNVEVCPCTRFVRATKPKPRPKKPARDSWEKIGRDLAKTYTRKSFGRFHKYCEVCRMQVSDCAAFNCFGNRARRLAHEKAK